MRECLLSRFSCIQVFVTPWTVPCQAHASMGFSRQEYWSGLICPPPRGSSQLRAWSCISRIVGRLFFFFFFFLLLSPWGSPPTPNFQFVKWINSSLRATSLHIGSRLSHLVVFLGICTVWELYRSCTKLLPSKLLPLLMDLLTLIWSDRKESIEKLTGGALWSQMDLSLKPGCHFFKGVIWSKSSSFS